MTGDLEFEYGRSSIEECVVDEPASVTAQVFDSHDVWYEVK